MDIGGPPSWKTEVARDLSVGVDPAGGYVRPCLGDGEAIILGERLTGDASEDFLEARPGLDSAKASKSTRGRAKVLGWEFVYELMKLVTGFDHPPPPHGMRCLSYEIVCSVGQFSTTVALGGAVAPSAAARPSAPRAGRPSTASTTRSGW
jgi:hypothetical protein